MLIEYFAQSNSPICWFFCIQSDAFNISLNIWFTCHFISITCHITSSQAVAKIADRNSLFTAVGIR